MFQPGEELLPKDASGKVIFDTVDLRDTWAVRTAPDTQEASWWDSTGWGVRRNGSDSLSCLASGTLLSFSVPPSSPRRARELSEMAVKVYFYSEPLWFSGAVSLPH